MTQMGLSPVMAVSRRRLESPRATACRLQFFLHLVPERLVHDRGMGSGPDLVLVPDPAEIDRVAQQGVDPPPAERHAAPHAPGLEDVPLGPKSKAIGLTGDDVQAAISLVELEDPPDGVRIGVVDHEFAAVRVGMRIVA